MGPFRLFKATLCAPRSPSSLSKAVFLPVDAGLLQKPPLERRSAALGVWQPPPLPPPLLPPMGSLPALLSHKRKHPGRQKRARRM